MNTYVYVYIYNIWMIDIMYILMYTYRIWFIAMMLASMTRDASASMTRDTTGHDRTRDMRHSRHETRVEELPLEEGGQVNRARCDVEVIACIRQYISNTLATHCHHISNLYVVEVIACIGRHIRTQTLRHRHRHRHRPKPKHTRPPARPPL